MIRVENVTKRIGKSVVLNDVSLVAHAGRVTGFKGVNGSGKTMLMRVIAGLVKPTSGEVVVEGRSLEKHGILPQSLGLLIENPAFLDPYTGFANLQMLAALRGRIGDGEVRAGLAMVGLDPDDKRSYRKYSLGMKQRLGIAAAVMERPEVVLLDEPTNALDESGLDMLRMVVNAQRERGATVVLASHDVVFLQLLADDIYEFEAGRVRRLGAHAHVDGDKS